MSITEGKDRAYGVPRKSIGSGDRIPNIAVFLKRTALEFLQVIFKNREAGSYKFDSDDTITEIQISDVHAVDLATVGRRPAIIAVRGPLTWQGTGLGGSANETRSMTKGDHSFSDLLIGSVALSCISREGIEAEQIAHLVFNSFKFFRPVLQKYGFFTIKSLNIGAESLIEQEGSDDKTTLVPIYVTAMVQDRWKLTDTAARTLEQIVIEQLFEVQGG